MPMLICIVSKIMSGLGDRYRAVLENMHFSSPFAGTGGFQRQRKIREDEGEGLSLGERSLPLWLLVYRVCHRG